jgi:hypothetical protein
VWRREAKCVCECGAKEISVKCPSLTSQCPLVTDTIVQGRILLDDLRVELKAGGVSAAHEDNVIARLQKEGRDSLPFIDYLVCVRVDEG